ncbi:MAG: cyclase family protein [Deltaproteobacteria bacterium]|nr:cyclase family protein [Deltaproteobacteria bacterium]
MNKLFDKVYDISVMLGKESIDFPGDTSFSRDFAVTIEASGICNVSNLTMSAHAGTHLDTPLHFIPNGKKIDEYRPEDFILPAHVVHIEDKTSIKPSHLQGLDLGAGDALLFKTDNCLSGKLTSGVFSEDFVYLTPEAADLCVEKKLGLVGIDYATIGKFGEDSVEVHQKLLGNGILILEAINPKDVPPGKYTLICLPLKVKDSEGSPVRAVLLD